MASSKTYVVEGSVKKSNLQDGGNKWKKGTVTLSQGEDNIWTCTAHIDVNPKSAFIEFKLLRNIVTHSYSFKDGFRVKLKGLTCFDVNNITKQTPSCSIREIRKLMDDAMNGELDSSAFSKITKHLPTSNGDSSSNVRPSNIYASFAPSIGSKNTPIASEHASAKFLKKGQQKSADSKDFIEQQSTRNFYGTNSAPPIASKFLTSKRPALMPYPPESGKRARIASPSTPEQKHATQYSWMSKTTSPFAGSKNLLQGFSNLGNTCYMNAILQALFGLDTFSSDLHDLYTCISERETSVNVELCRSLCCLLNGKHKQNVSLEQQRQSLAKVKQAISTSARRFLGYGQHDAHEFLSQVLDQLKEEIIKFNKGNSTTTLVPSPSSTPSTLSTLSLPPTPSVTAENALTPTGRPNPGKVSLPMKSPSKCLHTDGSCKRHPVTTPDDHQQVNNDDNLLNPISKNFEFGVEHTIYCLRCGDYVKKEESFHDLSLDIPKRRDNTIQSSMQDAVDCFFRREEVEYVCEKCHDNRAEVGHTFTKLPRVLVLHLKRYLFDQRLSTSSKMKKCIKIPSYLSLQLHCTENTQPAHPPTPSTYRYRPVNTMTESTSKTKRKLKFPNSKNAKPEPCELAGSDEEESLLKYSDSKQEANTSDTTTQTEENTEKITSDNDDDLPDLFLEPSQNNASKNLPAYEKEDYCVGGKSEDDMIKMALNASMQDADPQDPTPHATDNSRPESPQWLNARMPKAQSPDIKRSSASKPSLTFVNKPLPSPNGCLTKVSPKKADGARFLSLDRTSKKSPLNEKNGVHQNGRNSASNGITRNMESSTTGKVSPYFDNVQNGDVDNISSCSEADEDVVIVEEKFLTVNKTPGGNRTYMRSKPFFSRKVAQVDGCGDIPTEINECMDVEPHIPYNENISDNQSDDNSIYTNIIQLDGPVESGVQPLTNNDNNEHDAMSFKAARPSKQVISEAVKPKVTTPKAETHRDKAIMVKLLESEQYNTECTEKLLKVKLPELNNDEIVPCSNDSPGDMEALTEMDSMIDLNDSGTIRDGVEMEMCGDDDTLEQQVTEISPDSNKENFEPAFTSVNGDSTEVKPIAPMLAIKENGEIDGPWQNDKKEEDENELQKAIEMSLKEQEISTQQESDDIRKATELSLKDFDDYDETVLPPQEDYIIERSEEEDENIEKNSETGHLPYSYKLVSVVSHLGSASFAGHYVSDVLDMCKGQWSTYDDAHAIPTTENEVRSARTATGYIFFYINKDVYDDLTVIQKARLERAMSGTRLARPTTLPHTAPR